MRLLVALVVLCCTTPSFAQLNTTLLGSLSYGPNLNDIWGYAAGGKEYALVGTTQGTSIVDVTNPTAPVEVVNVPGANSVWRDLKTWGSYAYATNESGSGMQIIDLSSLPGSAPSANWTGGPLPGGGSLSFSSAHNIFIDENGLGYIVGANYGVGGAIIIDIAANPTNPPILGVYNTNYCHDVYVRNNIMYTAEIYAGQFGVVDVTNPASPNVLATQSTPNNFTHNTWLSDDGNTLFTTDETNGASVTSYDISDLTDINQLDRFFSSTSGAVPHNTFVVNDWVVTSNYKDGVVVTDVSDPSAMVEVANYDTSPLSGGGFDGCWGVYPYLPSGIVLASDQQEGLFIIQVNYTYGSKLQGQVTDASTGGPLFGATVSIAGGASGTTNLFGQYTVGVPSAGSYDVTFSAPGYTSETISAVAIGPGTTTLNEDLVGFPGASDCLGYCPAQGNTTEDEWISSITIGPLTNNSGDNGGYANFVGLFTPVYNAGNTYSCSFTPDFAGTTFNEYWQVWIDLNNDGDYDDAGEEVYNSGSASSSVTTGSLTIPSTANIGYTGMRVIMKYASAASQCGSFTYGEVEDYCIEITSGGGSCTAPSNPTVMALAATSVTVGWDAVPGALQYQAQGRRAGTTAFKAKATPVNSLTVNVQSGNTYEWQVRVQCSDGTVSPWTALNSFTTPIPKPGEFEATLYPNPASSFVRVSGLPVDASWTLVNSAGQVMRSGKIAGSFADVPVIDLASGFYNFVWTAEGAQGSLRVIVEH